MTTELQKNIELWIDSLESGFGNAEIMPPLLRGLDCEAILPSELKQIAINLSSKIEHFSKVQSANIEKWELGWQENLDQLNDASDVQSALVPKYLLKSKFFRVNGKYYRMPSPEFFPALHSALILRILAKIPAEEFTSIVELGAGSCQNIPLIHSIFPEYPLYACDWSLASVAIAERLNKLVSPKIHGVRYDYFGNNELNISNSLVLTIHSLEQIGNDMSVLERILEGKPKFVLHIEPVVENYYSESELGEDLIQLHSVRNYLVGLPSWLELQEGNGRIRIIDKGKFEIGSEISEPYSYYLWEPTDHFVVS